MNIKVNIPYYLRHYTNGVDVAEVNGTTVRECLHELIKVFPKLDRVLFGERGELDAFINIGVNNELLTAQDEPLLKSVFDGGEISLLFLVAGG